MRSLLKEMRIRGKLLLAYSVAILMVMAIAGTLIFSQVRTIIQTSIETDLAKMTDNILSMVHLTAETSIKNYMRAVAEKDFLEYRRFRAASHGRHAQHDRTV